MSSASIGPVGRTVARNIRQLRVARGLSLRALAQAVEHCGGALSADAINKIENGRDVDTSKQTRRVDADDLQALAAALTVTVQTLMAAEACPHCHGAPKPMTACLACGAEAQP
jgi:transcriptional regulator with XRE-family HTH domain